MIYRPATQPNPQPIQPAATTQTDGARSEPYAPETEEPARTVKLSEALFVLWLLGAVGVLGWALLGHIRFTRYLRRWGSPITERETFDTLNEWKSALELRRAPRLLTCPGLETPMLAGLLRPRLLLPADAMDLPQLRHVLLHELTHYKRRDIHFKLDSKLMRSKIGEDAAVAINEAFDVPVSTCWREIKNADCDYAAFGTNGGG